MFGLSGAYNPVVSRSANSPGHPWLGRRNIAGTLRSSRGNRGVRVAVQLLVPTALLATYAHTLADVWARWFPAWRRSKLGWYRRLIEGESYYTHGPLTILVSLVIAALLIRCTGIPVRPRPRLGAAVLAGSLLTHLAGCLARVNFISAFSLIGTLAGVILMVWGAVALRRLWFVLAMLAFAMPLPEVTIAAINFRLKMLATAIGVRLADAAGVVAVAKGNRVFLAGDKSLVVANVCNGLRTLISLLAFGALYAYVCRLRGGWRVALFAMALPVAVVSNSLRVLVLIVVADVYGVESAMGVFHGFSGIAVFGCALAMMFGLERLCLWVRRRQKTPDRRLFGDVRRRAEDAGQGSRLLTALGGGRAALAVSMLLATGLLARRLYRTVPPGQIARLAQALPTRLLVDGQDYRGRDVPLDARTLTVLETPTYVYRRYFGPTGRYETLDFCLIFSRDNRKGIHPPDLCLEGAGQNIISKLDVVVDGGPGPGQVPCRELVVETGQGQYYFLYTYKCGGRYTRSFWRQQFVIFSNGLLSRNAAGALIRVSAPVRPGRLAEARRRVFALFREAMPHVDLALP